MYSIPLTINPNQTLNTQIGTNYLTINLRTTKQGLFMDLYLNDKLLFAGRRCCNLMPLIYQKGLIAGNLYFKDLYGNSNPNYEEFNERFILIYDPNYIMYDN